MIGIPYIESLTSAILTQSKVIAGRFYLCPFWGEEINKLNISEVVSWVEPYLSTTQKYPAAILMPLMSKGNARYQDDPTPANAYLFYDYRLVFITNAYVTGQNQPSTPAAGTNQPTHTIPQTWHDMQRCAIDFLRVFYAGIINGNTGTNVFISERDEEKYLPVTCKGNDQVSGMMVRVTLAVAPGCGIEDYPTDYLTVINWPDATDTHPLHLDV